MSDASCAFEVSAIDRVISNYGGVEADVGLRESVANQEVFSFEKVIQSL